MHFGAYAGFEPHDRRCMVCDVPVDVTVDEWLSLKELGLVTENRPTQIDLARQIEQALNRLIPGFFEAGTGTGKSFAYLIPAILTKKPIVISTAKKSLQAQLLEKDLPFLRSKFAAQNQSFTFAPLYGKGNYVCKYWVDRKVPPGSEAKNTFYEFFDKTPTWHVDEAVKAKIRLPFMRADISAENCVGSRCVYHKSCNFIKDRQTVSSARIVVTNHWLIGYDDLANISEGKSTLSNRTLIVDEAHKFVEAYRSAFSSKLDLGVYVKANDLVADHIPEVENELTECSRLWENVYKSLETVDDTVRLVDSFDFKQAAKTIYNKNYSVRSKLENKTRRNANDETEFEPEVEIGLRAAIKSVTRMEQTLRDLMSDRPALTVVKSIDNGLPTLQVIPVDPSSTIARHHNNAIYLSATLAINSSFDIFKESVGFPNNKIYLGQCVEGIYGSAFNLSKQAFLFIDKTTPDPDKGLVKGATPYRRHLAAQIKTLTEENGGNAFVLFTSKDDMWGVADVLRHNLGYTLPLIIQKDSAALTLKAYKETHNAVLFGLKSFWEGVDIPGEKLSMVIITKLPFPGRNDPVMNARRLIYGDGAFRKVDLPEMIMDLRQGVGRLIRSATDRGSLAILDSRLISKYNIYGKKVIDSLGVKNVTTDLAQALKLINTFKTSL